MTARRLSRLQAERHAAGKIRSRLHDLWTCLDDLDRLLKLGAEEIAELGGGPAETVSLLCSRLADDLRAYRLVLARGYLAQAMTLGASGMEAALTILYIGSSEERAQYWRTHPKRTKRPTRRTPWSAAHLKEHASPDLAQIYDLFYEVLAAAKHHNPALLPGILKSHSLVGHLVHLEPLVSPRLDAQFRTFTSMLAFPVSEVAGALPASFGMSASWRSRLKRTLQKHDAVLGLASNEILALAKKKSTPSPDAT